MEGKEGEGECDRAYVTCAIFGKRGDVGIGLLNATAVRVKDSRSILD